MKNEGRKARIDFPKEIEGKEYRARNRKRRINKKMKQAFATVTIFAAGCMAGQITAWMESRQMCYIVAASLPLAFLVINGAVISMKKFVEE